MLDISDGIHDMGHVRWQLALCLLLAWTVVFLCLIKGVQSSGKVYEIPRHHIHTNVQELILGEDSVPQDDIFTL